MQIMAVLSLKDTCTIERFNFFMLVTFVEEGYVILQELQSVRGQLLAEQSRCFKLEVCVIQEINANFVVDVGK